jgi:hypothetical protein
VFARASVASRWLLLGVVTGGVVIFLWTARNGRVRLARNCLVFAVGSGVLGFASNLV